jgi:hypothetical protein
LDLEVGFGLGIAPATQINSSDNVGQTIPSTHVDAGLAIRALGGFSWELNRNFQIGVDLQALEFSQHTLVPGTGWIGATQNFEQVAPMLWAEVRL